ncbi:MAG TPA: ATP-binding protein [Pseudolabrys sp.]|nr:ATP-binding protein [Pseudolabrys sp.]
MVRGLFAGLVAIGTPPMAGRSLLGKAESILPAIAIALTTAIFIADTITDLEIAVPVFYSAVVLLAVRFCQKRGVVLVGAGCITLTLLSDLLTPNGVPNQTGVINTTVSLLAIASTTYLALKISSEKEATYAVKSQLAHVTRVITLGELTASIAHEVNQPLAAISINGNACLQWLETFPPDLHEAKRAVSRVVTDADRAGEIIAQVRNLTKNVSPEKKWVRLNDIILSTLLLVEREIQQNQISFETHLSDDLPPFLGDYVQLQQVILNLLLNSVEAMNMAPQGMRRIDVCSSVTNEEILISVKDTGVGIAAEIRDRIFSAFFTTKRGGIGMGLAVSRSIIESHGGRIWVTSNSSPGANFQFTLPIDEEAALEARRNAMTRRT